MNKPRLPWEGTALLFVFLFTILLGIGYNLSYVFRITIPWFALMLLAAGIALAVRYLPQRRK
jgi:ABC-type iron transport system FetAB permease component